MSIIDNISYWVSSTEYLKPNVPEKNLDHLANLKTPTCEKVALLASSAKLIKEGEPHPIQNKIDAVGDGIRKGFKVLIGAVAIPVLLDFHRSIGIIEENEGIFCSIFAAKRGFTTAFNGIKEGNFTGALQVPGQTTDLYTKCAESPLLFKALEICTPGFQFVGVYKWPILMLSTAFAIVSIIRHHGHLEGTQAQAREDLFTQLFDVYDRTSVHLVQKFEQAKMENDPQAMEACRQIARKIQGNLEYIKLDLAKCEKSLSTQEQDQIVSKVTEALDHVLKNSES